MCTAGCFDTMREASGKAFGSKFLIGRVHTLETVADRCLDADSKQVLVAVEVAQGHNASRES